MNDMLWGGLFGLLVGYAIGLWDGTRTTKKIYEQAMKEMRSIFHR